MAPRLCVLPITARLNAEIAKLERFDVAHLDYQLSVRHTVEGVRILLATRLGNLRRSAAISHTAPPGVERRSRCRCKIAATRSASPPVPRVSD